MLYFSIGGWWLTSSRSYTDNKPRYQSTMLCMFQCHKEKELNWHKAIMPTLLGLEKDLKVANKQMNVKERERLDSRVFRNCNFVLEFLSKANISGFQ